MSASLAVSAQHQAIKDASTLYLFDVEGTLVPQKGTISSGMCDFLKKVMQRVNVGVVSCADIKRLSEQLNGLEKSLDCVCAENGTDYYKSGVEVYTTDMSDFIGNKKMTELMNFVLKYISELDLPAKMGNFVETKKNLVNVSPVGRAAGEKQREEFKRVDKEKNIRVNFVKALKAKFSGLVYNIAGDLGIDIYPVGWDKTFCLKNLQKENFKRIHFFGDKINKGGNDYEIFHDGRVIGHEVTSLEDTIKKVNELLGI